MQGGHWQAQAGLRSQSRRRLRRNRTSGCCCRRNRCPAAFPADHCTERNGVRPTHGLAVYVSDQRVTSTTACCFTHLQHAPFRRPELALQPDRSGTPQQLLVLYCTVLYSTVPMLESRCRPRASRSCTVHDDPGLPHSLVTRTIPHAAQLSATLIHRPHVSPHHVALTCPHLRSRCMVQPKHPR